MGIWGMHPGIGWSAWGGSARGVCLERGSPGGSAQGDLPRGSCLGILSRGACLGGLHLGVRRPPSFTTEYSQQAGGTLPTGIHSCLLINSANSVKTVKKNST